MNFRLHMFLVASVLVVPIVAADPEVGVDDSSTRCINVGLILRTRIVDDSNIVFIMRRDEMYLNTLRSRCTGLARRGSFTYRIQSRSLCELERINVIEGGSIGQPLGRSCTLGLFHSVTMEDLEARFAPLIQERRLKEVEGALIEDVSDEDAEKETADTE